MKTLLKLMMKMYREQLEQKQVLEDLQESMNLLVEIQTSLLEKK